MKATLSPKGVLVRVSARAVSKEVALAHHAKAYVAIAREAGASDDEALDAIRAFLKDMP